jgi:anti-sigma B factor antagonist
MSLEINISMRISQDATQATKLALAGTLDTATAPLLEQELRSVLESPTRILIFDLALLTFLSSGGVRVILSARKEIAARGGSCLMLRVPPRIERTFEIIKALDGMMFFGNEEALDLFLNTLQTKPDA